MHSNSRTAAVAAFLLAAAAIAPATAADTDACVLLAPAQVSAALGVPVGAGAHTTPQYVKTCTWRPASEPNAKLKFVTLDVKPGNGFESARQMLEAASRGKVAIVPLGGVGDDAFYASFGPTITSLNVKKGATAFKLSVYGAMAAGSMAAEKALALQVVSQL